MARGRVLRQEFVDGAISTLVWDGVDNVGRIDSTQNTSIAHFVRLEIPTPAPNGSVTAFTLAHTPTPNSETVYVNGIAQDPTGDYTVSGAVVTISPALAATDVLQVSYYLDTAIAVARMQTPTPAVNGTVTAFTLAATPASGTLAVYLNGVSLQPGAGNDFTSSGTTLTMASAPAATDKLRVTYVSSALPSGVSSQSMQVPTPHVDGVTTVFSFAGQAGGETVSLNGVTLRPGFGYDYTIVGSVLTMAAAPAATDKLLITSYAGLATVAGVQTNVFVDVVDGRVIGKIIGTSVNEYGLDSLGSVTAYRDSTGTIQSQYRYFPYGGLTAAYTAGPFAYYLFGGAWNYENLGRLNAQVSAGRRTFDVTMGAWNTRDPWWALGEKPYLYAGGNPVNRIDPSGFSPQGDGLKLLEPVEAGAKGFLTESGDFIVARGATNVVVPAAARGLLVVPAMTTITVIGTATVLAAGVYSIYDLKTYIKTGKRGLITGLGDDLGKSLGEYFYHPSTAGDLNPQEQQQMQRLWQNRYARERARRSTGTSMRMAHPSSLYSSSSSPVPAPARSPLLQPSDVVNEGNCTKERYAELYNEVIKHCPGVTNGFLKWGNAFACTPSTPVNEILKNVRRWTECEKARRKLTDECDPIGSKIRAQHEDQIENVMKALQNCLDEIAKVRQHGRKRPL